MSQLNALHVNENIFECPYCESFSQHPISAIGTSEMCRHCAGRYIVSLKPYIKKNKFSIEGEDESDPKSQHSSKQEEKYDILKDERWNFRHVRQQALGPPTKGRNGFDNIVKISPPTGDELATRAIRSKWLDEQRSSWCGSSDCN